MRHTLTDNLATLSAMPAAWRINAEQARQHYRSRSVVAALMRSATGRPGVQLDKLARRVRIREWV
jgi:hypothetical protein